MNETSTPHRLKCLLHPNECFVLRTPDPFIVCDLSWILSHGHVPFDKRLAQQLPTRLGASFPSKLRVSIEGRTHFPFDLQGDDNKPTATTHGNRLLPQELQCQPRTKVY